MYVPIAAHGRHPHLSYMHPAANANNLAIQAAAEKPQLTEDDVVNNWHYFTPAACKLQASHQQEEERTAQLNEAMPISYYVNMQGVKNECYAS